MSSLFFVRLTVYGLPHTVNETGARDGNNDESASPIAGSLAIEGGHWRTRQKELKGQASFKVDRIHCATGALEGIEAGDSPFRA
jgi:hypothetical protein